MQCALDFGERRSARPARPERVFFALLPHAMASPAIRRVHDVWAGRLPQGRPVRTERLHLSLLLIGDYELLRPRYVEAVRMAATRVAMRRFELRLTTIRTFEGRPRRNGGARPRPLVLLSEGLGVLELYARLCDALGREGLPPGAECRPHVTILYGAPPVPPQVIEPIPFPVNEFALIHHERGYGRYNVLGRWPLLG